MKKRVIRIDMDPIFLFLTDDDLPERVVNQNFEWGWPVNIEIILNAVTQPPYHAILTQTFDIIERAMSWISGRPESIAILISMMNGSKGDEQTSSFSRLYPRHIGPLFNGDSSFSNSPPTLSVNCIHTPPQFIAFLTSSLFAHGADCIHHFHNCRTMNI